MHNLINYSKELHSLHYFFKGKMFCLWLGSIYVLKHWADNQFDLLAAVKLRGCYEKIQGNSVERRKIKIFRKKANCSWLGILDIFAQGFRQNYIKIITPNASKKTAPK